MPSSFASYFVASASAAAALIGLLFVAVSISPDRNIGPGAPVERRSVAEGAFTALGNAFFLSMGALIPGVGFGSLALAIGALSLWQTLWSGMSIVKPRIGLLNLVRRLFYIASGLIIYGFECVYALQLLGSVGTPQPAAASNLADMLLAVLAIGLLRAWQLLGGPRRGLLGWLSPLQPEKVTAETQTPSESETKPGER